jgi:signal transduction histidine kinase
MLKLSLVARMTLIALVAVVVMWMMAIGLFYRAYDRTIEGDQPAPARIAAIVELVDAAPAGGRQTIVEAISTRALAVSVVSGNQKDRLPDSGKLADAATAAPYAEALGARGLVVADVPSEASRRYPRLFMTSSNALEFRIALSTGDTLVIDTHNPMVRSSFGWPVGFGAGMLGTIMALLALVIMHQQIGPLVRIAAAADRIDPYGPPVELPTVKTSVPEIRSVVAALDRLQSRLSQLVRARMAMLGGISHDVRTFATRLRLRADAIPDPAERDRAIADIADMIRLLDDALLASRAGASELGHELIEFDEIVLEEIEDRKAAGAPIELAGNTAAGCATILGDRIALRRIVANLVDNALKYGGTSHLTLASAPAGITLHVDDEGPGVPADQREVLLEPFVRLETSRNRRTGGSGLGLTVVRTLVEAHGGSLRIDDAPHGGARFEVTLPVFQPA